jgi:zinc transporter 2
MGEEGPVRLWYSWKVSPNMVKLAALAVALCVFIVLEMPAEVRPILGRPHEANNLRLNLGDPTYEAIGGAEVVWHSPPNPKAILFLAHGCNHQATDFWHPTSACPQCTGLPEEVRIAR